MKALTILAAFMAAVSSNAAEIKQLLVRQQWPWSTDVKIEYMISGVEEPVDISVKFFNGDKELTPRDYRQTVRGDLYAIGKDGTGTIFFDPVKAFGNEKVALYNFNVQLSVAPSADSLDVLYRIYDLETGEHEDITKAQILNGEKGSFVTDFASLGEGFETPLPPNEVVIWTEVTNDVRYSTTKLVMRKISAKQKKFMMGHFSGEVGFYKQDEPLHEVTLTNDFFIGVFELTNAQWEKINKAAHGSKWSNAEHKGTRPVEYVRYAEIRGTLDESMEWPSKLDYNVAENSFLDKLRKKLVGSPKIDLPTEAQWEYACRAMSATSLNNGKNLEDHDNFYNSANLNPIARYKMNGGWPDGYDKNGNPTKVYPSNEVVASSDTSVGSAKVGSYMPNAWGLYDMHGNVSEICLDYYSPLAELQSDGNGTEWAVDTTGPATEPVGPARDGAKSSVSSGVTTYYRVCRGGSLASSANSVRSAYRDTLESRDYSIGFRLCLTLVGE